MAGRLLSQVRGKGMPSSSSISLNSSTRQLMLQTWKNRLKSLRADRSFQSVLLAKRNASSEPPIKPLDYTRYRARRLNPANYSAFSQLSQQRMLSCSCVGQSSISGSIASQDSIPTANNPSDNTTIMRLKDALDTWNKMLRVDHQKGIDSIIHTMQECFATGSYDTGLLIAKAFPLEQQVYQELNHLAEQHPQAAFEILAATVDALLDGLLLPVPTLYELALRAAKHGYLDTSHHIMTVAHLELRQTEIDSDVLSKWLRNVLQFGSWLKSYGIGPHLFEKLESLDYFTYSADVFVTLLEFATAWQQVAQIYKYTRMHHKVTPTLILKCFERGQELTAALRSDGAKRVACQQLLLPIAKSDVSPGLHEQLLRLSIDAAIDAGLYSEALELLQSHDAHSTYATKPISVEERLGLLKQCGTVLPVHEKALLKRTGACSPSYLRQTLQLGHYIYQTAFPQSQHSFHGSSHKRQETAHDYLAITDEYLRFGFRIGASNEVMLKTLERLQHDANITAGHNNHIMATMSEAFGNKDRGRVAPVLAPSQRVFKQLDEYLLSHDDKVDATPLLSWYRTMQNLGDFPTLASLNSILKLHVDPDKAKEAVTDAITRMALSFLASRTSLRNHIVLPMPSTNQKGGDQSVVNPWLPSSTASYLLVLRRVPPDVMLELAQPSNVADQVRQASRVTDASTIALAILERTDHASGFAVTSLRAVAPVKGRANHPPTTTDISLGQLETIRFQSVVDASQYISTVELDP